jgi:Trp operon repressor
MKHEIWKDIIGYEGLYQVSNFGRVRSVHRQVKYNLVKNLLNQGLAQKKIASITGYCEDNIRRIKNNQHSNPIKMLCPGSDSNGYLFIVLRKKNKSNKHMVHHLVLGAFIGLRPEHLVTRHLDGNRTNNNITNLKYGTHSENMKDKIKHGRIAGCFPKNHKNSSGSKNSMSKLTEVQVLNIKKLLRDKTITQRQIAQKYNVSFANISSINKNKIWKHVILDDY